MTDQTEPSHRAGLRAEIAKALEAADYRMDMRRGDLADAVLPVLYREWPWLRAEAEDAVLSAPADRTAVLAEAERAIRQATGNCSYKAADGCDYCNGVDAALDQLCGLADEVEVPLSPYYSHEACGFHWHGRDGMDIPMRDGQPVCPRCELRTVGKQLHHFEKRCEELRAESKRRGRRVLEQSERIRALERQVDEVREQLGAEILRAGQAEAELRRMADEAQPTKAEAVPVQHAPGRVIRCPGCRAKGYAVCLDEPQQPAEPPVHLGGRANAELCPACKTESARPWPFLCPAEPGAPASAAPQPKDTDQGAEQ